MLMMTLLMLLLMLLLWLLPLILVLLSMLLLLLLLLLLLPLLLLADASPLVMVMPVLLWGACRSGVGRRIPCPAPAEWVAVCH
jgi:hypothetical protein